MTPTIPRRMSRLRHRPERGNTLSASTCYCHFEALWKILIVKARAPWDVPPSCAPSKLHLRQVSTPALVKAVREFVELNDKLITGKFLPILI